MTVISGIILQVKSYYAFVHLLYVVPFIPFKWAFMYAEQNAIKRKKTGNWQKILKRFIERKNWENLKNSSRRIRFD